MKKAILCAAGAALLLLAVIFGVFIYRTRYKEALIDMSFSTDGAYILTLSSVGEPDWPFGSAHGRITLTKNGQKLSQTEIDLAEDGCQISEKNWRVVWQDAYAQVSLHASEQPDAYLQIFFDGRVEYLSDSTVEASAALSP